MWRRVDNDATAIPNHGLVALKYRSKSVCFGTWAHSCLLFLILKKKSKALKKYLDVANYIHYDHAIL
jgi:hypothetical protein